MLYWKFPLQSRTEKSPVCGPFFIQTTGDFFLQRTETLSQCHERTRTSNLRPVLPLLCPCGLQKHTVDESVHQLQAEVEKHLKDERRGERLRSGVQVVIAGATNAGKSSLLNTLCMSTNTHTHTS